MIDDYIRGAGTTIRDQASFDALVQRIAGELNEKVLQVAQQVEAGLTEANTVTKKLKGKMSFDMVQPCNEIKRHLGTLVYPGFVTAFGISRLKDWRRYIQGVVKRMEKLPVDPPKDRQHQLSIDKIEAKYQAVLKVQPKGVVDPDVAEVRWLIEELRVSLFAQQLGTRVPISVKRIENYLTELK